MIRRISKSKGFTLIELMIVVVIIGINSNCLIVSIIVNAVTFLLIVIIMPR